MYLHGTSKINNQGHLEIGGCDTVDLAKRFGTPLYVFDEDLIRQTCRSYMEAFKETGLRFQVAYASKAFCTMAICKLIEEEGLALDVVSAGELHTALKAGFPAQRIHFHGNNKTPDEIEYALQVGIGEFIVDNFNELELLGALAGQAGKTANILLRVSPGIEAHTHEYISTGQEDSKFGFDMGSGQAKDAIRQALSTPGVRLMGLHAHIGSQIFETDGFTVSIVRVADLYEWTYSELGVHLDKFNAGGGFGIRYVEGDSPLSPEEYVKAIADTVQAEFTLRNLGFPEIIIEPGRSIVGAAGTTLYTIGSTKTIPGLRKYVSVNGGMSDNPRTALYQAKYEAMLANRANDPEEELVSIAGKACESGDMLIWDITLPVVNQNDILAVSCTGAYNYSMASNYNRITRPAVVFVNEGRADVVVKRESLDDLVQYDIVPERMKIQV